MIQYTSIGVNPLPHPGMRPAIHKHWQKIYNLDISFWFRLKQNEIVTLKEVMTQKMRPTEATKGRSPNGPRRREH